MKRHVVVGTAGHIDHGKTALVHALTGVDTDRLAEEKRRGITIDLGFAQMSLPGGGSASVVDVPGHEDFIRNMVAGATGIDVALVVVAADEGVMPQTREHLDILRMLDVPAAVLALTKSDLVDPEWLELAADDLRAHVDGTPFRDAPVIPVSARTGEGLDALRRALADAATGAATPAHESSLFRMPVDRGFTVHGTGTVVTGTVRDGSAAVGDELVVLPAGRRTRVRALQHHGAAVERVERGMRAAIALAGLERIEAARGTWIVTPGWPLTSVINARVELVGQTAWRLKQRQRVRVHIGTAEVMARVRLFERDEIGAGESAWARLSLEAPVVTRYGERFVVRSYSPVTTIGGGRVLEPVPTGRRRSDAGGRTLLARLDESGRSAIALAVERAAGDGIPLAELPLRFDLPPEAPRDGDTLAAGGRLYARALIEDSAGRLVDAIAAWHRRHPLRPGMDRSEARRITGFDDALADVVIDRALEQGRLRSFDGLVAQADFAPTADAGQTEALERLAVAYRTAGLAPPRSEELPGDLRHRPDLRDLLAVLEREGALLPFPPDRLVDSAALEAARVRLEADLGGRSGLGPGDFRDLFDLPRKHLIPLLELFDRLGWTRRQGDHRSFPQKVAETAHPVP